MTRAEIIALMASEGFWNPTRMSAVEGTARDVMKRVDAHFRRMGISPYRTDGAQGGTRYTGDLLRSIHWAVFNRGGGEETLIRFYMSVVAKFVETASQLGTHTTSSVSQISPVAEMSYSGVRRRDDMGVAQGRRAKPFIGGEVRVHGRMLMDRLVTYYGQQGYMIMVSPFFDRALGAAAQADVERQMSLEASGVSVRGGWKKVTDDMARMDLGGRK